MEALARSSADATQHLPLRVNRGNPGATRTALRAQAMPGEDPQTLPHPSGIAKKIVPLASPALTETGLIFEASEGRFLRYRMPEPA